MSLLPVITLILAAMTTVSTQSLDDPCLTADGVQGVCKLPLDCPAAVRAIQSGRRPVICAFVGLSVVPYVCCQVNSSASSPEPYSQPPETPEPYAQPPETPEPYSQPPETPEPSQLPETLQPSQPPETPQPSQPPETLQPSQPPETPEIKPPGFDEPFQTLIERRYDHLLKDGVPGIDFLSAMTNGARQGHRPSMDLMALIRQYQDGLASNRQPGSKPPYDLAAIFDTFKSQLIGGKMSGDAISDTIRAHDLPFNVTHALYLLG